MNVRVPRRFSRVRLCVTLWTVAFKAPVSMGFPRKEYWSGLPLPSPIRRLKTKTKKHVNGCLDEIWNLESNDHQGETKTKKESLGRARPPPPRPSPPNTYRHTAREAGGVSPRDGRIPLPPQGICCCAHVLPVWCISACDHKGQLFPESPQLSLT